MAETYSPTLSYRLITWALFPLALAHTFYISVKHKNLTYLVNRFARYKKFNLSKQPIWCHCASVGEINTALPLLHSLNNQGESLVISTNTVTGYDTLTNANIHNACHVFLPLDYCSLGQRFINHFTPKLCLIFETELWPSLLLTSAKNNIAIAIMNGRISDKTLNAPIFLLKNYKRILNQTHHIVSSSNENSTRFISLGAKPSSITTLDNLKFANLNSSSIAASNSPLDYAFLLCASTHAGEEEEILKAWQAQGPKGLGLVIAPRHPTRIKEICQLLEHLGLEYSLHSNNISHAHSDTVYIIDTLGELIPFIAHAEMVFMGGSLVPVGGHNVIEPAQFKRCILIGEHYYDFKTIVDDLTSHNAIEIVKDGDQLVNRICSLTDAHETRSQMGERAYKYIESKKQVLSAYIEIVKQLLKSHTA